MDMNLCSTTKCLRQMCHGPTKEHEDYEAHLLALHTLVLMNAPIHNLESKVIQGILAIVTKQSQAIGNHEQKGA